MRQAISQPCRANDSMAIYIDASGSHDPAGRPLKSLSWQVTDGSGDATLASLVAAANAQ